MKDRVGRFDYGARFFERYTAFFAACERLPDDAVVLVLGANDGRVADPVGRVWRKSWRGFFVEPNPDIPATHPGVTIRAAVAEAPCLLRLWTMTDRAAEAYKRVGAHGSCLTSHDREHVARRIRENLAASADPVRDVVPLDVPAFPVEQLMDEYDIPPPDLIQVDIEGMEPQVVPQCIRVRPRILMWEHQHTADKNALENLARAAGYGITRLENDSLAVLC